MYHFPIYEGAAICGLTATYADGTVVEGVVKERDEAAQAYEQAQRQGKQANLLQTVRRDVFTLRVGNLPSHSTVRISLMYVTTLEARSNSNGNNANDAAAALVLPTCLAPRYSPPEANSDGGDGGLKKKLQLLPLSGQKHWRQILRFWVQALWAWMWIFPFSVVRRFET